MIVGKGTNCTTKGINYTKWATIHKPFWEDSVYTDGHKTNRYIHIMLPRWRTVDSAGRSRMAETGKLCHWAVHDNPRPSSLPVYHRRRGTRRLTDEAYLYNIVLSFKRSYSLLP
jgi:hypothetical protein